MRPKTVLKCIPIDGNFVMLNNEVARNSALSYKARGVLLSLVSHKEDWQIYGGEIEKGGLEGRESIRGAIQELERAGHLIHSDMPREAGKFVGSIWTVSADPQPVNKRTNRTKWREEISKKPDAENSNHEREAVNGSDAASGFPYDGFPYDGLPDDGLPDDGNQPTKKKMGTKENQTKENRKEKQTPETPPQADGLGLDLPEPPEWIKPADRSPEQITVGAWFHRRASTPWSEAETKAWRKITKRTQPAELAEEISLLATYYTAKIPPEGRDYRRRDVLTLLNNWTGELDRARNFNPNPTPKNEPESYKPKSWN